ncbi:MAG: hypothetical protein FWH35_01215 [Treponema sp.]|nr:hypothetical protein [Treponema sp.]
MDINEINRDMKEILKYAKRERIYDINGLFTGDMPLLIFSIGNPKLKICLINKNNDKYKYYFKRFKKFTNFEQKYYLAKFYGTYSIVLSGSWELVKNDSIIFDSKNKGKLDEKIYRDRLLFLFTGYKINNVYHMNNYIKIDFSNKMTINILRDNTIDSLFFLECSDRSDYGIGLSLINGIVDDAKKYFKNLKKNNLKSFNEDIGILTERSCL